MSVAIVVAAYNRLHLLRQCVDNVLLRTSDATSEILIWDNASDSETAVYLDSLTDPRVRVVHSRENIGQNAYARAFPLTQAEHLVQVDDDVIDAPEGWDATLLDAFERLPQIGYLAANIVDDGHSQACHILYRHDAHLYRHETVNGVRIMDGPTGGWCAMSSREAHDRVGGYPTKRRTYWLADAAYVKKLDEAGLGHAILEDLKVFHANGPYYSEVFAEKSDYWKSFRRTQAQKTKVKRLLLRFPFVGRLNAKFGWFVSPQ
jgi:GT2 family glycosyltransferase